MTFMLSCPALIYRSSAKPRVAFRRDISQDISSVVSSIRADVNSIARPARRTLRKSCVRDEVSRSAPSLTATAVGDEVIKKTRRKSTDSRVPS